jgi:TPR repeat protein
LRQAADLGHAKANFMLGEIYEDLGNTDLAYKFYHIAADLGDPGAQNELGMSYLCEKDTENALKYLNLAADQDDIGALLMLGNIYSTDKFVPHDYQKTLRYLTSKPIREYVPSLDQEDLNHRVRTNLYVVGRLYNDGTVVTKDLGMAFQYYKLAADQGYSEAQLSLGATYFAGAGVTMDPERGLYYYKLSANQGCAEAQCVIGEMWEQNVIGFMLVLNQATEEHKRLLRHDSKPKASAQTSNSSS